MYGLNADVFFQYRNLICFLFHFVFRYESAVLNNNGLWILKTTNINYVESPDFRYTGVSAGIVAKVNVSKKFFFQIDFDLPIQQGTLDIFQTNSTNHIQTGSMMPSYIKLTLNYTIRNKFRLQLYYTFDYDGIQNDTYIGLPTEYNLETTTSDSFAIMRSIEIQSSCFGLGIQYEL
jgi:hypothetical protein